MRMRNILLYTITTQPHAKTTNFSLTIMAMARPSRRLFTADQARQLVLDSDADDSSLEESSSANEELSTESEPEVDFRPVSRARGRGRGRGRARGRGRGSHSRGRGGRSNVRPVVEVVEADSALVDNADPTAPTWQKMGVDEPVNNIPEFPFSGTPGLNTDLGPDPTPLQLFELYFDQDVVDFIVLETNR